MWVILRPIWLHLVKRCDRPHLVICCDRCRYGKRYIMTKNFSPDAFMQVAFQCAYRFESRMFSTAFPFIFSQPRIWRNCQHVRNCDDQKVPSRAHGGWPLHHCCSRQILQSEMCKSGMTKPHSHNLPPSYLSSRCSTATREQAPKRRSLQAALPDQPTAAFDTLRVGAA